MPILGWRVHFTRRQLTMPRTSRPMLLSLPAYEAAAWLDREGIDDGVPFLLSPESNSQDLWIKIFYAASFAVVSSSGRSMSLPFSNFAPARTSATR